jgi:hypothetical protein
MSDPEPEVEDERPGAGNVDREEPLEVDDRDKVIGTFSRASGSRPTSSAAVALKSSVFCMELATIVDEGTGTTHCDVDEGPSRNGRSAWYVERVSDRTSVRRKNRGIVKWGPTETRRQHHSFGSIWSTLASECFDKPYTQNID